jgi:hypothetical protein
VLLRQFCHLTDASVAMQSATMVQGGADNMQWDDTSHVMKIAKLEIQWKEVE